jgi:hypothetical protein
MDYESFSLTSYAPLVGYYHIIKKSTLWSGSSIDVMRIASNAYHMLFQENDQATTPEFQNSLYDAHTQRTNNYDSDFVSYSSSSDNSLFNKSSGSKSSGGKSSGGNSSSSGGGKSSSGGSSSSGKSSSGSVPKLPPIDALKDNVSNDDLTDISHDNEHNIDELDHDNGYEENHKPEPVIPKNELKVS